MTTGLQSGNEVRRPCGIGGGNGCVTAPQLNRWVTALGRQGQFAAFLTYAALDPVEGYKPEDFRAAIEALPQEGLHEVAGALSQALEGAGEQRADYWKNRGEPFWHRVWPKARDLASNSISESIARMCIAAGDAFPSALSAVVDWLLPIERKRSANPSFL